MIYPRCDQIKATIPRLIADLHSLLSVQCKVVWRDATLDKGYFEIATFHPRAMGRVQMLAVTLRSANKSPKRSK